MRTSVVIVLVGLLALAACGSDGDSASEPSTTLGGGEAFVADAMATFDEDATGMTEADARCIVVSMVGGAGVDRLKELGIGPEDFASGDVNLGSGFTEAEANKVIDNLEGCVELVSLLGIEDETLDADTRACLAEQFDDDLTRRLFLAILTNAEEDPALTQELDDVSAACPGAADVGG